ncbi:hypothetical protein LBW62_05830 [Ralstonia solanacearum]|uniref:hypothetical protein n=1 Tax=Ralstonia solanacearum TaxID=305 RepID=UPI000698BDA4|nr:hypothetical protein [Ralstonia solanacearum]MBB6590697.1 hypothetical protein [Ralstonia solanacearum]MBB6594894.1 hypothetical protein [Ralstonia solanacearum]MDB0540770.1 hypothetical protein [Ralstonia solanacearum]MDB0551155.1 hypothetical protein [Ralstonia solanacearum]MDB0555716.1 hypothetical protein [Ralstonia solanacearum]
MLNKNEILIDIYSIRVNEGRSARTGRDYHIEEAACMTTTTYTLSDGQVMTDTIPGMVILPKHLNGKVELGKYRATVGLGQYEGKLSLRVVDLTPVTPVMPEAKVVAAGAGTVRAAAEKAPS